MKRVRIFEVGPRDGLQNEPAKVSTADKVEFSLKLARAGLRDIESGLFVRADRVPQMADSSEVMTQLHNQKVGTTFWCLVPNHQGLERAQAAGCRNFAVFTAATESFAKRNIGMSIAESLATFREVITLAKARDSKARFRAYLSTAFGCPFEGKTPPKQALKVIDQLAKLDVVEISIGDTIGVATPADVEKIFKPALALGKRRRRAIAAHFHDTRGTALANALRAFQLGVTTFDSSAGGLGGCPFAPGASGNLATEDLVYMFEGMGVKTGVDLQKLSEASFWLAPRLKRERLLSKYLEANRKR